jgi:hypothetical protein
LPILGHIDATKYKNGISNLQNKTKYSKIPIIQANVERRLTNNKKTWIIQNVLFGPFTELHKLLYLSPPPKKKLKFILRNSL